MGRCCENCPCCALGCPVDERVKRPKRKKAIHHELGVGVAKTKEEMERIQLSRLVALVFGGLLAAALLLITITLVISPDISAQMRIAMSVQLLDKNVSTEDVTDARITSADYARLEAVLSMLVENKVVSIRESKKAEKRRLFGRIRSRSDDSAATEPAHSTSTLASTPRNLRRMRRMRTPSASLDEAAEPAGRVVPQQSFDSYDASKHSDSCCCSHQMDSKAKSACLPKHLSTQEWLNAAASRQASTETATTSSGYISPTSGAVSRKADASDADECTVVAVPVPCSDPCCTACLPSSSAPPPVLPPHHHLHPAGGHYVSCCNSPAHSEDAKIQYDDNYIALAINLEDLEFEQEEERRKRRKRKKKRRKERQARARGLMADELKNLGKARLVDPDDLPKRARWTIVATACLLLLMSMLLVGVTLRMAPIIDDMVRRENDELRNSLSRQGIISIPTNTSAAAAANKSST